jgi:predicted ATPase
VTRDDIIAIAQESVIACPNDNPFDFRLITLEQIEHFAALVAAAERERLAAKFMEMHNAQQHRNNYFAFAARVIKEEK